MKTTTAFIGALLLSSASILSAKPIRTNPAPSAPPAPIELGGHIVSKTDPKTAKPSPDDLQVIADTVTDMNDKSANFSDKKLEQVVFQPQYNQTAEEDIYALSRREFFLVVDNSGSMMGDDAYPAKTGFMQSKPTGQFRMDRKWCLYDSALLAAEGVFETVLSLDADNTLDVIFLNPVMPNEVIKVQNMDQLKQAFMSHPPRGTTPMAEALQRLYDTSLRNLLQDGEPYVTLVFTDGAPNNAMAVKNHLASITKEHRHHISPEQLDTMAMAAYSFIQMGDDRGATRFLEELDNELTRSPYSATCDIVDTKKDNFIFGNEPGINPNAQGPIKLIMDAIKD